MEAQSLGGDTDDEAGSASAWPFRLRRVLLMMAYDLTWNLIAAVMIAAGAALMTGRAGVAGSAIFRSDAGTAA